MCDCYFLNIKLKIDRGLGLGHKKPSAPSASVNFKIPLLGLGEKAPLGLGLGQNPTLGRSLHVAHLAQRSKNFAKSSSYRWGIFRATYISKIIIPNKNQLLPPPPPPPSPPPPPPPPPLTVKYG